MSAAGPQDQFHLLGWEEGSGPKAQPDPGLLPALQQPTLPSLQAWQMLAPLPRTPSPPPAHGWFPSAFQVSAGNRFFQAASLTTTRQGQMLLFTLSAPCTLCPPILPLPLGEGRACWIFCLPPQAMKSTGPVEDLACPSQLLTQHLPESLLPG